MTNLCEYPLEQQREILLDEIEKIKLLIEMSDVSTFEIMIDNVKQEMYSNVAEEDWKALKNNKAKIEKFRDVVKILQNQEGLLEKKRNELEDVEYRLKYNQIHLIENAAETQEEQ